MMELDNVSTLSLPPELSMNCIEKLRPSKGVVLAQENTVIAQGDAPRVSPHVRGVPTPLTIERYK